MIAGVRSQQPPDLAAAPPSIGDAAVVELRQYRLVPGGLSAIVDLFETHFLAGQEDCGIRVGAVLLDPGDPTRFVWMRGFHDMEQRREALASFYGGAVWQQHRAVANAAIADNDDVFLLRATDPVHPPRQDQGAGLPHHSDRPTATPGEVVHLAVAVHTGGEAFETWMAQVVHPQLERHLGTRVAMWRTEPAANSFPALPVREDRAVVWSAGFTSRAAHDAAVASLRSAPEWTQAVSLRLERETTAVHHHRMVQAGFQEARG